MVWLWLQEMMFGQAFRLAAWKRREINARLREGVLPTYLMKSALAQDSVLVAFSFYVIFRSLMVPWALSSVHLSSIAARKLRVTKLIRDDCYHSPVLKADRHDPTLNLSCFVIVFCDGRVPSTFLPALALPILGSYSFLSPALRAVRKSSKSLWPCRKNVTVASQPSFTVWSTVLWHWLSIICRVQH